MAKQRFSTGCEFVWRDALYQVRRVLPNSILEVENVITQSAETVAYLDLYKALLDGELRFAKNGKPLPAPKSMPDLSELSDKERQIAEYRLEVIRPLLNRRSLAEVQARVVEVKEKQARKEMLKSSISQANIYRWIRVYNGSGHDIRSLVDNNYARGGRNMKRINEDVNNIIKATIKDKFFVRTRTTTDAIFDEVLLRIREENKHRTVDDQLPKPSRATVARRIREVDVFAKVTAKRGRKTANRELRQYGAMDTVLLPMERVEIDHTVVDLIVVDPKDHLPLGRLTITLCIDVATRYPVGYYLGFEPPSYLTVMECLYHAILPKTGLKEKYGLRNEWQAFGVPNTLIVDNGKEFIGRDLQDACAQLGVVIERNPVQTPHLKPMVERLFGTLNTGLFHTISGTTFSNIFQRGDYDSVKHACISLDELNKILVKFLVEIYAENTHRGLGGIPARAWEQKMMDGFLPYVPNNFGDLLIALGRIEYRTIRRDGIYFQNIRYNSNDLVSLRTRLDGNKVKFKYHPADLSRIHIYDEENRQYVEAQSVMPEYTDGLSLWKHRVIVSLINERSDKPDRETLAEVRREIQEIVSSASARNQKLRTRKSKARWETGGQTPSLEGRKALPDPDNSEPEPIEIISPTNSVTAETQPITELSTVMIDNDFAAEIDEIMTAENHDETQTDLPDIDWDDLDDDGWGIESPLSFTE